MTSLSLGREALFHEREHFRMDMDIDSGSIRSIWSCVPYRIKNVVMIPEDDIFNGICQ